MKCFEQSPTCSEPDSKQTLLAAGWRLDWRKECPVGGPVWGWHQMAGGVPYSRPVLGTGVRDTVEEEAMVSGWKRGGKEMKLVWRDLNLGGLGSDCATPGSRWVGSSSYPRGGKLVPGQ